MLQTDAGDMMDVSGVDFDEDMEEEAQPVVSNKPVAEVAKKNSFMLVFILIIFVFL